MKPETLPSPIAWRLRLLAAAMVVACAALAPSAATAQQVVAVVNGELITAYDIEQRTKLIQLSNPKPPPRQQVLEELIDEKVKLSVIKRWVMEVSDKEVDSSYARMARGLRL